MRIIVLLLSIFWMQILHAEEREKLTASSTITKEGQICTTLKNNTADSIRIYHQFSILELRSSICIIVLDENKEKIYSIEDGFFNDLDPNFPDMSKQMYMPPYGMYRHTYYHHYTDPEIAYIRLIYGIEISEPRRGIYISEETFKLNHIEVETSEGVERYVTATKISNFE